MAGGTRDGMVVGLPADASPTARLVTRALTWPLVPLCLVLMTVFSLARPDSAGQLIASEDVPFLVAMAACWLVGVVITGRVFAQPAGWAFLGLGTVLAWSGVCDTYADYAVNWNEDARAAALAATLSDSSWIWWFVFLALVLTLTPPARPSGRVLSRLPMVTVLGGVVYQVAALLRPVHLDRPYQDIVSPWAVDGLGTVAAEVATVAVLLVGGCLIGSVVTLVVAWRRAEGGETRQQLLWLVAGASPLVPSVVASFVVSYADHAEVAGYLMSVAVAAVALGAALSVLRYRLYDVERVVTDSAAYAIAAVAVLGVFLLVLLLISETTPADASSQLPTVLATLAAAAAARSAYVWARQAVEKRVNRGRFDAVETVRAGLTAGSPDLDSLLADALGDAHARIVYPADGGAWVTSRGHPVEPASDAVDVRRRDRVTAKIEFDPGRVDPAVVEAVAATAGAEIDNVALRAELARQIELITESRARLATAQLEERRRLERDLHDGAQQRLLGIALQLQSARVNGAEEVLAHEVDRAVSELGLTVQDLRDLAGGLQPAALAGGGLLAAVVDMVSRVPVTVTYDVVDRRFEPSIESAAWFVVSEAVTNVVKHSGAETASIRVTADDAWLRIVVADCGVGGADPRGHGLQGLSDRIAAAGGRLRVGDNVPHGTVVEAELPCAS